MPFIPCLKHKGSYILYIKLDQDKAEFICEECCLQLYEINQNLNIQRLIHIKSVQFQNLIYKAFKSPQLLLPNMNYSTQPKQKLNEFDKLNENCIKNILKDINTQITNIQNSFQLVQQELEYYAKQFLNMKQKFKDELEKLIKFDQFKQIIENLENLGDSINTQIMEQNEKILYQYLQDLKKMDHTELYLQLFDKMKYLRIEFKDLKQQYYPECQKLQDQLKSFSISQLGLIEQINLITFKQFNFLETQLLQEQYQYKILCTILSKINKININYQKIYLSYRDGLNGQAFWNKVNNQSNLLMIFKSKSGNIFGAFSPCQWVTNSSGGYIFDNNNKSSFIFSQTQDQIQIFPIKEGNKQHAIYCYQSYGPTFGGGHDIQINSDFQGGYSNLGHSYSCEQYQISNKSTHLFGQSTPNIVECEIFMLTFA
ncbi:unnamed protein product (macronuclear) [Paramecium tetraurelia]|uniref:TLDc domain-containing protein n=1 Tax=Paramecium tetraurelia TaxID=5888 RepID=A0E277_PARTE|nr:uncharacterized protein GSPATT00022566001 [Paramecium tetraurelia]CAK89394.1 unnamed protein product [Paramecium tetraurelia]|eukprot:XP_001456791.1 hypothetical protein (macronuclear) [Paramecium tetraurelia strain d4-2]